jgi:hypothetical protein
LAGKVRSRYPEDITVDFDTHSDAIISLSFTPSYPIELQDVIKKYGEPSLVKAFTEGTPEYLLVDGTVFYDINFMYLILPQQQSMHYNLQPATRIERVIYFSPQEYKAYIQFMNGPLRSLSSRIVPWKGYAEY